MDLTPVTDPAPKTSKYDTQKRYADCTGPQQERAPDSSVDMGTGFDCFDEKSHTLSKTADAQQHAWRLKLVEAMALEGFHNYAREWWHFTYGANQGPSYSFSIPPRERD